MPVTAIEGFEGLNTGDIRAPRWVTSGTRSFVPGRSPFAGSTAMRISNSSALNAAQRRVATAVINTLVFGVAVRFGATTAPGAILGLMNANSPVVAVRRDAEGRLYITRSTFTTALATTSLTFSDGQWRYFEGSYVQPPVGNPTFILRVDGQPVLEYTGALGSSPGVTRVALGSNGTTFALLPELDFDDFYAKDDEGFLGDCVVELQRPTSTTLNNGLTLVGATTVADAVDDTAPDGATSYAQGVAVGSEGRVGALTPLTLGVGTVHAVAVDVFGVFTGAATRQISATAALGGAEVIGPPGELQAVYSPLEQQLVLTERPGTGGAFAPGDLDALQIGWRVAV